jgi:hypothetical protein
MGEDFPTPTSGSTQVGQARQTFYEIMGVMGGKFHSFLGPDAGCVEDKDGTEWFWLVGEGG